MDETSWRVFEEMAGKANHRWWLWIFVGFDTVAFLLDPTRSTKVLSSHLGIDMDAGSLAEGRHLLVSSDFFTSTNPSPPSTAWTPWGAGPTSAGNSSEPPTPTRR